MSDTKVDPWALLREARGFVEAFGPLQCPEPCESCKNAEEMTSRIDAALAAHEAEERVEWTQDALGYHARVTVEAEIEVFQDLSGEWQWNRTALSSVRPHGCAATLDEAQRAAIAAARGMR